MTQNRRDFMKDTGLIAWGLSVPAFLSKTAMAAPDASKPGSSETVLVVIELTGGNDGLNTVIPFKDPTYAKLRPTLKQNPNQIRKITKDIGLHPVMTGFEELYEDSALGIVQGVGYPNPTQSHFRSMDIWQAGGRQKEYTEGWLGRALLQMSNAPTFHLKSNDEGTPLALKGAPVRVPSIDSLAEFTLKVSGGSGKDKIEKRKVIESSAKSQKKKGDLLDFVNRTATSTYESSRRLQEIGQNYTPKVPYPDNRLANRLQLAAKLIDANLGARMFYVQHGNFDTHASQAGAHANLLTQLSTAVTAFYKDMKARGHSKRLMIMTFSEFGRRPYENGSRGTDHGTAAPMFLVGGKVNPGLIGDHPNMTDTDNRNLKHSIDFRQVYAEVMEGWLGVDSRKVLQKAYKPVNVIKG